MVCDTAGELCGQVWSVIPPGSCVVCDTAGELCGQVWSVIPTGSCVDRYGLWSVTPSCPSRQEKPACSAAGPAAAHPPLLPLLLLLVAAVTVRAAGR